MAGLLSSAVVATDHLETIFRELGVTLPHSASGSAAVIASENPSTGAALGNAPLSSWHEADAAVSASVACFAALRDRPGPQRGELVRRMGERLRVFKEPLAWFASRSARASRRHAARCRR
jgi:aldehyde dehydrogenase (NAD+)